MGRAARAVPGRPDGRELVAWADRPAMVSRPWPCQGQTARSAGARWLKAGNEPRLRGLDTETMSAFAYLVRQKVERPWKRLPRGEARRGRRKRRGTQSTLADRQVRLPSWR
jgi:hypothetical protein